MSDLSITTVNNDLYTPSQYSTIAADTLEAKKVAINAVNNAQSLSQHEGETLNVIGVMTMPGVRKSRQQGMPDSPCTNTYLVCADGSAYFSQSEGVRRSADSFMQMNLFSDGEVVPMKLVSTQMSNGNTFKTLELL